MRVLLSVVAFTALLAAPASALDRPWISDVFFYWYTWDYDKELGGWMGGVYNTPLRGYYDSRTYQDNLASLHDASEWGMTHHFMDYWGPAWQDDRGNPREDVLIRATEDLQQRGYDVFMSVYQDGTDFDMAEFSRNLDPGRHCEFYLKRFATSPAYPTIGGKPVFLIYGRNGRPELTATDEGFRAALEARYRAINALNQRWGADFGSFADIGLDFGARGHHRAESIKYQYRVWADEIARTNRLARERFGLPGCIFSWDVGYAPFYGHGYSDQARVFCGPHSYGGVFGVPHQADVERFIQAQVARKYDTVFFDTFKNFYHDWEIRIPGSCYPPDFCAFDRFWVQALSHYSQALLHLSWNEWWEGSNLEPCYEFGKTYCEKNLLYATIMKQCFDSIRNCSRGARVAVLLNDWHWLAGGRHPQDIYACIQAQRRSNVRFDLLPDDFVTADELDRLDVVIAPSGAVGFGYNAQDQPIADLLLTWARQDQSRRLLIDDYPGLSKALGLAPDGRPSAAAVLPGPDMSLYVDLGVPGDERFVIEGASQREDWGKLPPDKFGAAPRSRTVRWTPATGLSTTFLVPFSPHRDHVLRLGGSAIWGNQVQVLVDATLAAEFEVTPGSNTYEIVIPAAAVGGIAFGELTLKYSLANVPGVLAPDRYGGESRVCNLALDWLQLATANLPFSAEQDFTLPEFTVSFARDAPGALSGLSLPSAYTRHQRLAATDGALSTYAADGAARDLVIGNVLYVNGLFGAIEDERYLDCLIRDWAACRRELDIRAPDIIATVLSAGDTDVILAYNYAAPEVRGLSMRLPSVPRRPIVEVTALSRDGRVQQQTPTDATSSSVTVTDQVRYYAVYQAVRGPVALQTPRLSLAPGEARTIRLGLQARARGPRVGTVEGTVSLVSHLPSLTSDTASFSLTPDARTTVPLTLTARDDLDWGEKTVIFDVEVAGRHSYFWRALTVTRLPDLQVATPAIDSSTRRAEVVSVEFPWAEQAVARGISLTIGSGHPTDVGDLGPGDSREVVLPPNGPAPSAPEFRELPATLDYTVGGVRHSERITVGFAHYPEGYPAAADAVAPVIVCNPHDEYLENALVSHRLDPAMLAGEPAYVRDKGGGVVPSQVVGETLYWIAMLPPETASLYYLCAGAAPQPATDLTVTENADGITVSNSDLTLGWSAERGGTLTTFRSHATGRDYAAGSFGAGHGTWGTFNPLGPRTNTVEFVGQEQKTWQRDAAGQAQVQLGLRGPVLASVEVSAAAAGARYSQRYLIGAYQGHFTVASEAAVPGAAEEIVALDARLARHDLTKIFPDFTGISAAFVEDSVTGGWREATYVPPYATMMTPNEFRESISLIPCEPDDAPRVSKFRQGFWPETRPQAGPVDYAQIELIATNADRAACQAYILLHSGHQVVARRFRETRLEQPPTVIIPRSFEWLGESVGRGDAGPPDWWNPYWHFALPVTVGPLGESLANPRVTFRPDFDALLGEPGTLDPASPRAIVQSDRGACQLPVTYERETGELTVTLTDAAWPDPRPDLRDFTLYFDALEGGPKRMTVPAVAPLSGKLLNGSFENGGRHWSGAPGLLHAEDPHSGEACVRLEWQTGLGPVVVSNATMALRPESKYLVAFWARTTTPDAALRTNFYAGPSLDFPQFAVPLQADGRWHRYEQTLPVGKFPQGVNPALRFWVLGTPQTVHLDDVEVAELEPGLGAPRPPVKLGQVVRR